MREIELGGCWMTSPRPVLYQNFPKFRKEIPVKGEVRPLFHQEGWLKIDFIPCAPHPSQQPRKETDRQTDRQTGKKTRTTMLKKKQDIRNKHWTMTTSRPTRIFPKIPPTRAFPIRNKVVDSLQLSRPPPDLTQPRHPPYTHTTIVSSILSYSSAAANKYSLLRGAATSSQAVRWWRRSWDMSGGGGANTGNTFKRNLPGYPSTFLPFR